MTKKDLNLGRDYLKQMNYALKNWQEIKTSEEGPFAHLQTMLKSAQGTDSDKFKSIREALEEFCGVYQELIYKASNIEYMVKISFERDNERTPENEEYLEIWRGEKKELVKAAQAVGGRLGVALDAAMQEINTPGAEKS